MRNRIRSWSLHQRLIILSMAPAAVMFIVLLLFLTSARISDARQDLHDTAQLIADNLAPATEYAVVSGNRAAIEDLLDVTLSQGNLARITIRGSDGRVIGEALNQAMVNGDDLSTFRSDIIQTPVDLAHQDTLGWLDPIQSLAGSIALKIGSVEVAVSERVLDAKRWTIIWTSAILGLALLLVTSLFASRFAFKLSVPIQRLADRVGKIGSGHYEVESEPLNIAELDRLQSAIVAMAAGLENADAQQREALEYMASARDKAESASRAKTEFLAMMSHELRTPLNGVLGMLDLVDDSTLTKDQEDCLRTARSSTEDLLTIITDLLDFSRIERGRLAIQHVPFSLQPLIENCAASFRYEAELKGLDYEFLLRGPWDALPQAYGDPIRLRQVIANLIENAIKFTDQGQIVITVQWTPHTDQEGFLSCEVSDSGAGIPGGQLDSVFNSLEQLDASPTRRFGGTGLGLALVQRLVELMGGHVTVDSAVACGSTFRFTLPVELVHPLQATVAMTTVEIPFDLAEPSSIARHHALVVEDNPVNQRVAQRILESLGFTVDCAENGAHALEVLTGRGNGITGAPYDIILMDCQMPVMDGWEATRRIRVWEKQRGHSAMPVVAMTAHALEGTEASCRAAGMDDYLAKPVRRENIRATLKRWLTL